MDKFIEPIKQAVEDSSHSDFLINLNYEIIISDNGKSLFHCNYYDFDSLKKLFNNFYQDKRKFFPDDVEINIHVFRRRLDSLMSFLSKMGEKVQAVDAVIIAIKRLETKSVLINSTTCNIFDDMNHQIFTKRLATTETKNLLRNFCHNMEISKKELLNAINQVKSP